MEGGLKVARGVIVYGWVVDAMMNLRDQSLGLLLAVSPGFADHFDSLCLTI